MKRILTATSLILCLAVRVDACDKCHKTGPSGPASYSYAPASYSYAPASYSYAPASYSYAPASYGYAPASYGYAPASYSYAQASYGYAPAFYDYGPASSGGYAPAGFGPLGWLNFIDRGVGVVRDNACPACRALGCCSTSSGGSDTQVDATTSLINRVKTDLTELAELKKKLDEFGDLFQKKAETSKPEPAPGASADSDNKSNDHLARLDRILIQVQSGSAVQDIAIGHESSTAK